MEPRSMVAPPRHAPVSTHWARPQTSPVIAAVKTRVPTSASRARSFAWTFFVMSFENQLNATRAQTRARMPPPAAATRSTSRLIELVKFATGLGAADGTPVATGDKAAWVGCAGGEDPRGPPIEATTSPRTIIAQVA